MGDEQPASTHSISYHKMIRPELPQISSMFTDPTQHQYHQQHLHQQQHFQHPGIHVQLAVDPYQSQMPGSSRLPDTPPITDLSPSGFGSPTSASSLYSPDKYRQFRDINDNNGGPMLGANDVSLVNTSYDRNVPSHGAHHALSTSMHNPYQPSQMSPPETIFPTSNVHYPQNMIPRSYSSRPLFAHEPNGVVDGQFDETSFKRVKSDFQSTPQPSYDVKPDLMIPHFPQPQNHRFLPSTTPRLLASPLGNDGIIDEPNRGDSTAPLLRFIAFREETWHKLYDANHQELHLEMTVIADKGFTYSKKDDCFVNQKKNHFQVTVNIKNYDDSYPAFARVGDDLKGIGKLLLPLCGIKAEAHTSEIPIKQSDASRTMKPHHPLELEVESIKPRDTTTVTDHRLHFSLTTLNNMRKNKDQKYFLLLVRLRAIATDGSEYTILAYASERIIVRASNPGQFDPVDAETGWEQAAGGTLFTNNPVAIGTPNNYGGALNVNGSINLTGWIQKPSDRRLKENIRDLDKKQAMERQNRIRVVEYSYKKEVARALGMKEEERHRTGIIADELNEIHPQSVNKDGEFLTVSENGMFYDNIAAVQELSTMHEELEGKIEGRFALMQAFFGKIFKRKRVVDDMSVPSEAAALGDMTTLATSHYSLASAFKMELAKQQHESCSKHDCDRSDTASKYCSKLTQATIITLVVVMAVCLLSMSALYILDWHHRNYGIHSIEHPIKSGEDDGMGMMKKTIIMPRHQPGAPPLHDMCLHAGCRSYCCDDKVSYATETRMGGFDPLTVKPLAGSKKAFLAAIAGAEKMTPTAFFPKPLISGIRIDVVGMNMTIDSRYCTERSCNEKKGRYDLFVPVSPYMPNTHISLKITPPLGMFVLSCGNIFDFQEDECSAEDPSKHFTLNMPTAVEVESNIFEVSAGSYKRSGYRFRVGSNTESCFGAGERFKSSYDEYNLIFYRTCGESRAYDD